MIPPNRKIISSTIDADSVRRLIGHQSMTSEWDERNRDRETERDTSAPSSWTAYGARTVVAVDAAVAEFGARTR